MALAPSSPRPDLKNLAYTASEAFRFMEPWSAATSKHPVLEVAIAQIKQQGTQYYRALNLSIVTADEAYELCEKAEYLCDALADSRRPMNELKAYLETMRQIASESYHKVRNMCNDFRSVRQRLTIISRDIPTQIVALTEQKRREEEKAMQHKRNHDRLQYGRAVGAVAGGVLLVALVSIPPAVIVLPILIPCFIFIGEMWQVQLTKKLQKRQERQLQCAEAISELGKVAGYLGSADTHLEKVISWWLEMDTILRNLQSQVEKLRADHKGGGTRVWDVKRTWGGAKTDFFTWKVEFSKVQDRFLLK